MKAAIRKGILGYTFSFSPDYPSPADSFQSTNPKCQNDILVKISSAAINPVDYKVPRAMLGKVIGIDFCGTITEIGSKIDSEESAGKKFEIGDVVFGTTLNGSLAEYTIVKPKTIAKAPKGWKTTECAALPVAYQSALQCLRKGNLLNNIESVLSASKDGSAGNENTEEKSILIIGASGGCGLAGLQLCKALGISRIVAICSKKNEEFVRDHGATEVVDYSNASELESFFFENSGKFDGVYDAATNSGGGEDYWNKSLDLLKRDQDDQTVVGQYTALNGPASKWIRALIGREFENESIIMTDSNTADLELITQLLDKISARPLTNVVPFDEKGLQDAFKLLKSRRARGKIVFEIQG